MKALADKITDETWGKGCYTLPDGRRCIVGLLRTQYQTPDNYRDYCEATRKLAMSLGWTPGQVPILSTEQSLVYWNDCPSTTAEMVAQACAKAGV